MRMSSGKFHVVITVLWTILRTHLVSHYSASNVTFPSFTRGTINPIISVFSFLPNICIAKFLSKKILFSRIQKMAFDIFFNFVCKYFAYHGRIWLYFPEVPRFGGNWSCFPGFVQEKRFFKFTTFDNQNHQTSNIIYKIYPTLIALKKQTVGIREICFSRRCLAICFSCFCTSPQTFVWPLLVGRLLLEAFLPNTRILFIASETSAIPTKV